MEGLEDIVRGALYTEVKVLSDGKSIVMDPETEHLYYRKVLSVYSVPVFRFLKEHAHKNLPAVHMFWQEEGNLVVIEDLIQGKTLDQMLDSGSSGESEEPNRSALPFEEKKRILLEICDGLQFLHSSAPPIIHRDIKASNIMITGDGAVKIIDYDAAKQYVAEKTKDTVLMGTQGVAAPEQYGFGQSDARTDIYAMGKLIERMLPESKHAMNIARKATRLEPDLRYENVTELRRAIEKLWDPAIPDGVHRWQQVKSTLRSRKTKWIVIGVVIAAVLTAGGIWFKEKIYPEYFVLRPAYDKGIELMASGEYEEAIRQFEACGEDYRDCKDQIRACRMEMVREGYEADAREKVDAWKAMPQTGKEIDALNACVKLQTEGLDNGEKLEAFCKMLLEKSKKEISEDKARATMSIFTTVAKTLKDKSEPIRAIRDRTLEEYRNQLNTAKEYSVTSDFYTSLAEIDSADYSEEIKECTYLQGKEYLEAGAYQKAADTFLSIYDYKDSQELKKKSKHLLGKKYMGQAKYVDAVKEFLLADKYEDSEPLANACKYYYCNDHQADPDDQTRIYMDDLKKINYPGISDLSRSLETWKVSFEVGTSNEYEFEVKITFTGGPRDGMKGFKAIAYEKSGKALTYVSSRVVKSGFTDSLSYKNNSGSSARSKLKRIEVLDNSGNLIGSFTP